jgi:hypothetical protein
MSEERVALDKILMTADLANESLVIVRLAAESAQLSILQKDWAGFRYHIERMILHVREVGRCSIEIRRFSSEISGDNVPDYQKDVGDDR